MDEIGTEAEALACRSIAERGVQLVGTAHGQLLENLIKVRGHYPRLMPVLAREYNNLIVAVAATCWRRVLFFLLLVSKFKKISFSFQTSKY